MTNLIDRRAALGRLAATIAAVLATPAAAEIAEHPDAELFALQGEIDAADREFELALSALSPAQERFYEMRPQRGTEPSPPADPEWDKILASFGSQMKEYRARKPAPERGACEEEMKLRKAAELDARTKSGLDAAETAQGAAQDAVITLRDQIVATPAKTLAGLIFKAKYAAAHYPGEYDQDVMDSVIDDLLAMSGETYPADEPAEI